MYIQQGTLPNDVSAKAPGTIHHPVNQAENVEERPKKVPRRRQFIQKSSTGIPKGTAKMHCHTSKSVEGTHPSRLHGDALASDRKPGKISTTHGCPHEHGLIHAYGRLISLYHTTR
eukprot:5687593-Amphidinium_carterae.1